MISQVISKNTENNSSRNLLFAKLIITFVLLVSITIIYPLFSHGNGLQIVNAGDHPTIFGSFFVQLAYGQSSASHLPAALQSFSQSSAPSSLSSTSSTNYNLRIDMTSPQIVHGVAGQFVTIKGYITNPNPRGAVLGGTAYISLVDNKLKIPVDLEDWSAEKGLYIPSIQAAQTLPLEWNVRLVKAGSYTVDILFNKDGDYSRPVASSKILLDVAPKLNLNPGNVLPVVFGVPAVLMAVLGAFNYIRGKKTGVYS